MANAVYGIATVVAPIVGPTLGGWITDSYSWRWIFLINVPIGVILVILIGALIEEQAPSAAIRAPNVPARPCSAWRIDWQGTWSISRSVQPP